MDPVLSAAAERLAAIDTAINAAAPDRRSLAPSRSRAHSLVDVWRGLCADDDPPALVAALAEGLAAIAAAELRAFPANLFWDFDYLAAALIREARGAADPAATLADRAATIADLQRLYGRETAIRFTYVHDFVYGYDWAKWVRRDPPPRRAHGPFSAVFLGSMEDRGHELLALIDGDDRKYPSLAGERPRNPFPFSRAPAAELQLHRELARRGELPIEAWRADATPRWDRDYAAIRAERARVLGLSRPALLAAGGG